MVDLTALKAANARRWANAQLQRRATFVSVAQHLIAAKARYQTVAQKTGVPWFVIAVIHERESSQSWSASLAQGDPWDRASVHVPAERGPFPSWEAAAIDALVNCAPHLSWNKDWSLGGLLTALEGYNGMGYAMRGIPSSYLWAGTDQYEKGKFVRDGKFDPNAVDSQLGCAGLLMAIMVLDKTVKIGAPIVLSPTVPTTLPPSPPAPSAPRSIGSMIAAAISAILSIFRRKQP